MANFSHNFSLSLVHNILIHNEHDILIWMDCFCKNWRCKILYPVRMTRIQYYYVKYDAQLLVDTPIPPTYIVQQTGSYQLLGWRLETTAGCLNRTPLSPILTQLNGRTFWKSSGRTNQKISLTSMINIGSTALANHISQCARSQRGRPLPHHWILQWTKL